MKKFIIYGTTALLSFSVFLVLFAPAGIAFRFVKDDVARIPETTVYRVGGTVWEGGADIQYRDFPTSTLRWTLAPIPLMKGLADFHITIGGLGHELDGGLLTDGHNSQLSMLNGFVTSEYIDQVSAQYGLRISGNFAVNEVDLTVENDWFTTMEGDLSWTGGQVLYPVAGGSQAINLPALDGKLAIEDRQLTLNVQHNRLPVLSIFLGRDGWARLEFYAQLFVLADLPLPEGTNTTDIVLTYEEKIL